MYKEDYTFKTPPENLTAWRYIDFEKLISLLLNEEIFFCRSDNFEDPFEGQFRLKDYEQTKFMFEDFEKTKKYYFLNCWHLNEFQSDAMWKIFLKTNNGLAIKSTIRSIKESFRLATEDVHIGKIYYKDYETVTFSELMKEEQNRVAGVQGGYTLNQFNYKRISFEHEKELRLYYIDNPIPHVVKDCQPRKPIQFKKIKVVIPDLINQIVISPFADKWFPQLVRDLLNRLDYKFDVVESNLYNLVE